MIGVQTEVVAQGALFDSADCAAIFEKAVQVHFRIGQLSTKRLEKAWGKVNDLIFEVEASPATLPIAFGCSLPGVEAADPIRLNRATKAMPCAGKKIPPKTGLAPIRSA